MKNVPYVKYDFEINQMQCSLKGATRKRGRVTKVGKVNAKGRCNEGL